MILLGYRFKPKLWAILVTVVFFMVFVSLGKWQLSRADEKNARQERLDYLAKQPIITLPGSLIKLEEYLYREVELKGEYQHTHTIYLDNKSNKGRAGYHILTPIRLLNSSLHVVINRGWVPTGLDRAILPDVPETEGEVKVTGIVVSPEIRTLELSSQVIDGPVWGNFNLQRFHEVTKLELQPIIVLQKDKIEDGLVREWDRPDSGSAKNISYAFQWFSLAITTIIIFLALNVRRENTKIE